MFAKVEQQLQQSIAAPSDDDIAAFNYFESNDPNLAIAMLRVQIERRLRQIAEEVMSEPPSSGRPRTLRSLVDALSEKGKFPKEAVVLLRDLMPVMNEAVHGVELGSRGSEFALNYGPKFLALIRSS